MLLGKLISAYMLNNGLSLRQLEVECGCDKDTLHRLLKGNPVRTENLIKVFIWMLKEGK